MAATATKKEVSVAEKLDALFELQKIDSEIDRIRTIRGELPLEVSDLEDELEGLETRINKIQDELKELETEILDRKNACKDESLAKEIEFQELEIKLHDKKSKEAKFKIDSKKELLTEAKERFDMRTADLKLKKAELDEIVGETQKEEDELIKKSNEAKKKIDERLVFAYNRLRSNAKNGLAVVPVDRKSCGGCFNKIPPQRQLDIESKKKVIVCEHCGRILMPVNK
jgi:predicted  nucleic acid-binding Zn-ribbon protein